VSEIESPSDDVLVLHLSPYHSLDLVRIPTTAKIRIVFAERWGVQRRAFVEVSFEEAALIAAFLGRLSPTVAEHLDPSPVIDKQVEDLPLPPHPPRTRTRGQ
jgi:hypothetical protein